MARSSTPKTESSVPGDSPLYLMGITECARRMSTTVPAIRALIRSGRLRYVQIGHRMLLSQKAIADFIVASERTYGEKSDADVGS